MKPQVIFDDFSKLDLVVGRVLEVSDVLGSEKLYRMTVDLGTDYGTRAIFAGVKKWHTKAKLKGKQFAFVANLAPKKMPSFVKTSEGKPVQGESQGMMLAADSADKPTLIPVASTVPPGTSLR